MVLAHLAYTGKCAFFFEKKEALESSNHPSFLHVHPFHPLGDGGENLVGNRAQAGCKFLHGQVFSEDDDLAALLCRRDVGDIEHGHVHAHVAGDGG